VTSLRAGIAQMAAAIRHKARQVQRPEQRTSGSGRS
jgi:hypothetical protein